MTTHFQKCSRKISSRTNGVFATPLRTTTRSSLHFVTRPYLRKTILNPLQKDYRWGILLPICSRRDKSDPKKYFFKIGAFFSILVDTVPERREWACLEVYFGINSGDVVFDSPVSETRLATMVKKAGLGQAHFLVLHNLESKSDAYGTVLRRKLIAMAVTSLCCSGILYALRRKGRN